MQYWIIVNIVRKADEINPKIKYQNRELNIQFTSYAIDTILRRKYRNRSHNKTRSGKAVKNREICYLENA